MARVQLVISDEDRDRFVRQAQSEGMTLSEWLRAAAHRLLEEQQRSHPLNPQPTSKSSSAPATRWKAPNGNQIGRSTWPFIDGSRKQLSNS